MRRSSMALAVTAMLTLVLGACAEGKDTGFPPPVETSPGGEPTAEPGKIEVIDNDYEPKEATVDAGTTVTWFQTGAAPHTVTFDDGSFESHPNCQASGSGECMGQGDEVEYEFTKVGTYPYYCRVHGQAGGQGMAGTVVVE